MTDHKSAKKLPNRVVIECQSDGSDHQTHKIGVLKKIYQYRHYTDMTRWHDNNFVTVKYLSRRQTHVVCLSPWQIFYGYEVIIMSSCHIGMMSVLINLFYRPVVVCLVVESVTLTLCHYPIREFFCTFVVCHVVMWITLRKKALTLTYICCKFLMLKCCHFSRVENKGDFALSSWQNPKII